MNLLNQLASAILDLASLTPYQYALFNIVGIALILFLYGASLLTQ